VKCVLPKSIVSLLDLNHIFNDANSVVICFLKSSKLELVIMTLVSSANKIVLDFPLIVLDK
jgi:hypothetical protein